jgi:hypothetical protein
MTQEEALKQALGYVERNCPALVFGEIKEALAQPAQEPVGTLNISRYKGHLENHAFDYFGELPDGTYSVYITPPAPLPVQPEERNFCQRCGKRTADLTTIHTCTPPQIDPNQWAFDNGLEST